ncbi:NTP transferase domain-containing protein [Azospirillum agricola]|uniref:NTP transferase domain-containing protein n=1 Tax=Azospirillum agricola TaxID=1720247 RepID=UPI000A0EF031|nr:NTP transferase domain-containing protein [Azospirillum agricola]SMH41174.1 Phosphotransferase enzyme family protein [Azospirillum lipoferum]
MTTIDYVVVQAGGKGSRLQSNTWNKPKCLVPVLGRPLLYHLFDLMKPTKFIVIGDHLFDVLERYVATVPPPVEVTLVRAEGTGTCAGIAQAMEHVPSGHPFLLVWSDLFLFSAPELPDSSLPVVALSDRIRCRWSHQGERGLVEEASADTGVIGLFRFPDSAALADVPRNGEFVRWLAGTRAPFDTATLGDVWELGEISSLEQLRQSQGTARFFNEVRIGSDTVTKVARDPRYAHLLDKEARWYKAVSALGYRHCPDLLSEDPFTIRRIDGRHPYALLDGREGVLERIVGALSDLHALGSAPAASEALRENYWTKTVERVDSTAPLIPNFGEPELTINGLRCRNWLHPDHRDGLERIVAGLGCAEFRLIHGDPTFSNTLVGADGKVWLIDPRGYFGSSQLYGDPMYDWAKLYYSVAGDYDAFNRKKFALRVAGAHADLFLVDSGWSKHTRLIDEALGDRRRDLRIIHALIWLSLTGYATDDVDSVLGAFYRGLLLLEEALS